MNLGRLQKVELRKALIPTFSQRDEGERCAGFHSLADGGF